MLNQFDQVEQQGPSQGELRVDIDLRSKAESIEPEWLDQPEKISPRKRKVSLKPQPLLLKQSDPFLEELNESLEASKRGLRRGLHEYIRQEEERLQRKVYASETNIHEKDYLRQIYDHTGQNKYVKNEISETVRDAQVEVQRDIKGKGAPALQHRRIPRSKQQLKELEKMDHNRMLKVKEGEARNDRYRQQPDHETIKNRLKRRIEEMGGGADPNYYSIEHPRTKEAEFFVKEVQHRRKEEQHHYDLMMSARKQRQEYQKEKEAEMKEIERMERRTKLKEYYESKLQHRLEQKEMEKHKKEEFKEWIKAYQRQRPIEAQKQEQYRMRVLIPQLQERHKKLMTIKAEHKPIDPEELAEHEMKYIQFLKDDSIRKRATLELAEEQEEMRKQELDQRFYKGRYRLMVLQQMLDQKYPIASKEIEQSKKERIKAYAQIVREGMKSHHHGRSAGQTLQAKSNSNQKFVRRVRNLNGSLTITKRPDDLDDKSDTMHQNISEVVNSKSPEELDARKQGIKNLAFIKNQVRESLAKEQQHRPVIHFVEEKEATKTKGFLQLQREKRLSRKKEKGDSVIKKETHSTDVTGNEQIQALKAEADMMDQRLKRHQVKIKNVHGSYDDKAEAEQQYVSAIRKKLQILDKFN